MSERFSPILVESLIYKKIKKVVCGAYHSITLSRRGEVFSWGSNEYG